MAELDSTNPQLNDVAEETLDIRHLEFSSRDTLLMSAFSLPNTPSNFTIKLRCIRDAPLPLLPALRREKISNFGKLFIAPIILGAKSPIPQKRELFR